VRFRPLTAVALALALAVVAVLAVGFVVKPVLGRAQSAAAGADCDPQGQPYGVVQIDTYPRVDLDLARTPEQREFGLMYREQLGPDNGMLFVYPSESNEAYWMYHTLLPLSIAFIAQDGTIVDIKDMPRLNNPDDVQEASRTVYPSAAPYWYALEVNEGWFVQHGVGVGQQFMFCLGA
jgi:uncharacterized membrane protein (UPF0127 family)